MNTLSYDPPLFHPSEQDPFVSPRPVMGKLGATNLDIVMTPLSFRGDVVPQHSRRAQTAKARKDRLQSDRQHHWTADEDNASASSHGRHDYIKGEELLELLMPMAREPPATPAPSCRSPACNDCGAAAETSSEVVATAVSA